jgi:hypothetical protein
MHGPSRILRTITLVLIPVLSFAFEAGNAASWAAPPPDIVGDHARVESFVLEQLKAGNVADLRPFENPEDRILTPDFIDELLRTQFFNQKGNRRGIHIEGARFNAPVDIDTEFSSTVWLGHCEFLKDVDFSGSHFAGTFQLDGSTFEGIAAFRNMVIGGDFSAMQATFERSVDFTRTLVDGVFSLDGANFLDMERDFEIVDFDSVVVKGALTLDQFSSERIVRMPGVQIRDIVIQARRAPMIDLSGGSTIQNDLDLDLSANKISVDSLKVAGTGFLRFDQGTTYSKSVDLSGASFGTLVLDLEQIPGDEKVSLDGMTYQGLRGKTGADPWTNLLNLLNGSAYSADPYLRLEAFLKTRGYDEQANDVLVTQKRREREFLKAISPKYWWSLIQDGLVRYGSQPFRPLLICLALVLVGALIFNKRVNMEPQETKFADRQFSPFWYSLDLFFPVFDLQVSNQWMPRQAWRFGRFYAQVHRVLGWIFTGLALATIRGIFG